MNILLPNKNNSHQLLFNREDGGIHHSTIFQKLHYKSTIATNTINTIDHATNNIEWNVKTITGIDSVESESDSETPFSVPSGIAIGSMQSDGEREILISDCGNNKIRRIKSGLVITIAGCGEKGFNRDGGVATLSKLNYPSRIARCENGDLYIADRHNHRIRKVSALDGTISTIAGTGREGYNGDGIPAIHADLYFPTGIAIDEREGEIFISDFHNHRIRRISLRNGLIQTVAGIGERGYYGDGGFAVHARICCPTGIAVSKRGDVYFSDSGNNVIRKISTCGIITTVAGNGEKGFNGDQMDALDATLNAPSGIAVSRDGEVYFADIHNNRICKITKDGMLMTIAGNAGEGYQDGPLNKARFKNPSDIAIDDESGDVYVVDGGNNAIRKISATRYLNSGRMRKYDCDCIVDTKIYGVRYLIQLFSPQFYEYVLNSDILGKFSTTQLEIVQHLIDELIYHPTENWQDKYDSIDVLSILGLFQGCEFIELKKCLVKKIKNSCSQDNIHLIMEKIDNYRQPKPENIILTQLFDYCIRFAALLLRDSSIILQHSTIIKHITEIAHKISEKLLPSLHIQENVSEKRSLSSIFNDKITSDITIVVGRQRYHCHKTILSSNSLYFEELFKRSKFDEKEFQLECKDLEIGEMIIKYCYDLLSTLNIKNHQLRPLLNLANNYEMKKLSDFCALALNKQKLNISVL